MRTQTMTLHAFREESPSSRWKALFDATWPAYRRWYLSAGTQARPSASEAQAALARFMPELMPTWHRLVDLSGGDSTAAAMLTHWNMPAFAPGCSQLVIDAGPRALIRNYDYHPELFEQVVQSTRWSGRSVLGTSDCLWGLLDGMNDDGLAVSLAFGGARGSGPGFGIPLVVRYLLETCSTVAAAVVALGRIPVAMSYNLTLTDRGGDFRTAYVAPGRPVEVRACGLATNHRFDRPDDTAHATRFRSVERRNELAQISGARLAADEAAEQFLRPPLRSIDYAAGFGTLYTADYRPDNGEVHYRWPGNVWTRTFDSLDAELRLDLPIGP